MRAFTITIESASTVGKAVIHAASFNDAHNKAAKSCPPGFRVTNVLDNEREQKVSKFDMTEARLSRGLRSSHGHAADKCSLHARVNHSDHVAARGPKKGASASKSAKAFDKKAEKAAAKRTKARVKADAATAKAEKKAAKEALADVLQELGLQQKAKAAKPSKRGRPAKRRVKRRPAKRRAKKAE